MLLSLVVHTYSLRYWLPAAVMLGTAPAYLLSWSVWRLLSTVLPSRLYHTVDDRVYSVYQSMVLFFFENYTGVEIVIYGDIPKKKENVVYVSNHQSTADWIIADMLAIRQNALGHVRYVLKDGLKWLPLYGWYFSQHGGVYVKRSANFDEKAMKKKLSSQTKLGTPSSKPVSWKSLTSLSVMACAVRSAPNSISPMKSEMYLVIFPEGTRYNPELQKIINDSQDFAAKEGLAVLKHVLTPRMKASHVAIETMKEHLDAVYDITVAYEGTLTADGQRHPAPTMPEFLCQECPRVHIHFSRLNMREIPAEPVFFRRWLHERFEIKDKLLTTFYDPEDPEKKGRFPGESQTSNLSLTKTLPSLLILGGLTLPMLFTESGRKLYLNTWLYGTLIGWVWVSVSP
ncbi:1-acyl-sn-glycerol-3-phosphate acyltransferase epsilon-like isoform X1 [Cyprinus carpio]|uniref:1-acyl-sn-glycerol-3-phosphate acyltransferase epsilon-like isoform X1 n=2 Tax=Cyprinus carpio TaxID=7962 RepID=A0A8C1X7W9_CYPCA|nr:1-acyl-sn-glycerol-3-phosphate acyltransferase epsilon-like isoform X1 [Cyprinus carpio]